MNTFQLINEVKSDDEKTKAVVIQNFITARPPRRTTYNIDDWRQGLTFAEMIYGNRVQLYDIYTDVMLDPHLDSQWGKRKKNITNTSWMFSVDGEPVDEMKDLLDSPEFEMILDEIMESIAWGITVMELGKTKVVELGQTIDRLSIYSVDRKHIYPKDGVIVKEQMGSRDDGIRYREGLFANYVGEIGEHDDLGLLLKATPYMLLKRGGFGDWALFVQLFGQPFREYRYNGFDQKMEMQLRQSAEEMGSAPYVILPDGATVNLHDIKMNPGGDTHKQLVEACDKQISILVLGATETTTSSQSSGYAQSETHMETQQEIFDADMMKVRRLLNRVIRPILYNLGWPVKVGEFHPNEEVDISARIERVGLISKVTALGTPVDDEYIYEQSGIPKPANYDALKAQQQADKEAELNAKKPVPSGAPKGKPADKKKTAKTQANLLDRIRITLADFFDPAP